jgi:hypothetical protein
MKPKNLLIYYGYPSSFNYSTHQWDKDKIAEDMSKYSVIVFAGSLSSTGHSDHNNMNDIISKVRAMNPDVNFFGYTTTNQSQQDFEDHVDEWDDNSDIDGIFMDQSGYDYGTVATNGREAFNDKVDYVHEKDLKCFVNAWKIIHVIGLENDPSYPNATWNSRSKASKLNTNDIYLMESLAVNTNSYANDYEDASDWQARMEKMVEVRKDVLDINIAAVSVIDNSDEDAQDMFDFSYIAGLMGVVDYFGSSDEHYGASSSTVAFWDRPEIAELEDLNKANIVIHNSLVDSDIYQRCLFNGRLKLDFSSGSELSDIEIY